MPRQNQVKKSRRVWRCAAGHDIPVGSAFVWLKWRNRGRINRCVEHMPFQKHETQSSRIGKMSRLDDIVIDFDSLAATVEGLRGLAEVAEDIGQEYSEGVSNMPEGLQAGPTGQAMEQIAEEIETWVQELNARADEAEGWVPDEDELAQVEEDEGDTFDREEAIATLWETSSERDEAESELDNKPQYQG